MDLQLRSITRSLKIKEVIITAGDMDKLDVAVRIDSVDALAITIMEINNHYYELNARILY